MSFVSTAVQRVLEDGQFCAVAAATPNGPHCTPLVFAYSGARLWLTTSRGSVKARAWRVDRSTAGLIRDGDLSVAFTGTVKTYDALDKRTWGAAVAGATSIARATAGFSRKNARFFAGYAFDARQVPFAWTPPGRVFVGVDLERTALLDDEGVQEGRGRWRGEPVSHEAFRRSSRRSSIAGTGPCAGPGIGITFVRCSSSIVENDHPTARTHEPQIAEKKPRNAFIERSTEHRSCQRYGTPRANGGFRV